MHKPLWPSNHRDAESQRQKSEYQARSQRRSNSSLLGDKPLKFQLDDGGIESLESVHKNNYPRPSDQSAKELFLVHSSPPFVALLSHYDARAIPVKPQRRAASRP